ADATARAAARAARAERAAPAETREPRASRPAASPDEPVTRPRSTRLRSRDDNAETGPGTGER
ncbi:MAG: hypothetical protein Q7K37_00520, partial [Dehalococcoidia bacterium]|nr:hypothetical protein [Dehalococcoidia bacterium]